MGLSVKVCKFIIYRHFMKSVNGPNFPVLFLQSLPVMMVLLNLQQDLASLFVHGCSFNMFAIFFDPSQSNVNCKSVLLIVSPNRGRSDGLHTKVWNFVPETQMNSCMMLAQKNIKF